MCGDGTEIDVLVPTEVLFNGVPERVQPLLVGCGAGNSMVVFNVPALQHHTVESEVRLTHCCDFLLIR